MCKIEVENYLGQVKRLLLEDGSIVKGLILKIIENDIEMMLLNGNTILIGISSINEIRPTKVKANVRAKFKDIYNSRKKIEKHLDMIDVIKREIIEEEKDFLSNVSMLIDRTGYILFNNLIDDEYVIHGYSVDIITDAYDLVIKQVVINKRTILANKSELSDYPFIKETQPKKYMMFKTSDKYKSLLDYHKGRASVNELRLLAENLDILNSEVIDTLDIEDSNLVYSKKIILNVKSMFKNKTTLNMVKNISRKYIDDADMIETY